MITVLGILLVLMVLLRAVVAPLYLVGTVLVSYGSAVGLSAWFCSRRSWASPACPSTCR